MGIVFAGFFHAQSVRFSLPHVNGDMRPAHHVPPPVQPGTPAHPLMSAVSQELSRSDLVQELLSEHVTVCLSLLTSLFFVPKLREGLL